MTERPSDARNVSPGTGGVGKELGSARGMALMISLLMIDSMHFVFARLLFPYIEPGLGAFYVISFAAPALRSRLRLGRGGA